MDQFATSSTATTIDKNLLFYLIYPATVAVVSALFSFFGSYRLQKNEKENERLTLKQDFIERMTILLDRLNLILEKLSDDPTKYNYFSLQTIATIKPLLLRLQSATEEKLALFSEQSFRSDVLNTLDEVTTTIEEIESEESNPVRKFSEHQAIEKETIAEYSAFRIKLLELGFYLDVNNDPQDIDVTTPQDYANAQKKNQIKAIVQGFITKINNSRAELDKINEKTREHRAFLAVKLLHAQSKVKDLIGDLNKRKLSK